ncbi:MAG TPA: DUF697 domain-containing protein [Coriobacteriia bacterium]|nr:DUF697 domain-containing protein [Coriobacteriia bacterium]
MALPLDIREMMSSGQKYRAEREKPVRMAVFVDAEAPEAAVKALRTALLPQTGNASLHIEAVVPGDVLDVDSSADVVVALTGPGNTVAPSLARTREHFIPTVALALEFDREAVARRLAQPLLDTLVDEDPAQLIEKLGAWLGEKLSAKRVALAANFAFVRRAVADEAVKSTAFQNAVIGGVAFIPGADMPLMTANQAKMVMQIAAAYGEPLGAERVKELATVVGGAFVLRTIARQFVGLLPGFGWALKAGIGYSGTLAMGYAAIEYFEGGGDVRGLASKLKEARDHAIEAASTRIKRGQPAEIIPADAYVVIDSDSEPAGELPAAPPSDTAADAL